MAKIYSYIEVNGKPFVVPQAKAPETSGMIYLAEIDGRHYVSVSTTLPTQPKEILVEGPINLKLAKNKELAAQLQQQAEPLRFSAMERSRAYPSLGDQLGALMKEFQRRRDKGEKLAPELDAVLDQIANVKKTIPKADLGLE